MTRAGASVGRFAVETARRGLYEVKTIVARSPAVAIPIARRRHGIPVGDDTEIVIEGFPRSGTSFAVAAFDLAQDGKTAIACHVHAPAMIIEAARRRLPAVVIVRRPSDTVLSFVIRNPHLSIRQGLRGYVRFYEPLLPHLDATVVGTFEQVTTDFGSVIERVNGRFGTAFNRFDHTEDNVRRCLEAIDADYRRRLPEGEALERQAARPSEWRRRVKEQVKAAYDAAELSRARAHAEGVFGTFADAARR